MAVDPWSVEGLVNFLTTGVYDPTAGVTTPEEYVTRWIANGGISKLFGDLTTPLSEEDFRTLPWPEAMARSVAKTATAKDVATATRSWVADQFGVIVGTLAAYLHDKVKELNARYPGLYDALLQGASIMMQQIINRVAGTDFPVTSVFDTATAETNDQMRLRLGGFITQIIQEALPLEGSIKGFLNREPGEAEWDNYARISGVSMRLQLGDILASWISSILPFNMPDGFKDIAERIDKAIALEDSIEEIIQVPMQAAIQRGMEAWYNRKLKPVDYSDSEARQAHRAGLIDDVLLNKVLDNLGVRDDTRQNIYDLEAPNLTEAEIDEAYQRNLLSEEEVKKTYQAKTFIEPERSLKTTLVVKKRRWKLEENLKELYGNLYRDGVATRQEVTPFLEHLGYEPDEIDMWFQIQELERRQRKFLTVSQILDLVDDGMMQPDYAIEYLVFQGMTGEDATVLVLKYLLDRHKKELPADCQKILAEAFSLPKVLASALGKIPEFGLAGLFGKAELQKIIQCLLTNTTSTP